MAVAGAIVAVGGMVLNAQGPLGLAISLLAGVPFVMLLLLNRRPVALTVGTILLVVTIVPYVQAELSQSSTAALRIIATIPNNLAIIGLVIGGEGLWDHGRGLLWKKSFDNFDSRIRVPLLVAVYSAPPLIGGFGWFYWGGYEAWAAPSYWFALLIPALALAVSVRSRPAWPLGILAVAVASLVAIANNIGKLTVEDAPFLLLPAFPFLIGGYVLGGVAEILGRVLRARTSSSRTDT